MDDMADDRAKAAAATLQALEEAEKNGNLVGYQKQNQKQDGLSEAESETRWQAGRE